MKTSYFSAILLLILFMVPALPAAHADDLVGSDEYAGAYHYDDAHNQARETATDSSAFDGGSGSTSNTSTSYYPVGDVPDIGPSGPVEE